MCMGEGINILEGVLLVTLDWDAPLPLFRLARIDAYDFLSAGETEGCTFLSAS